MTAEALFFKEIEKNVFNEMEHVDRAERRQMAKDVEEEEKKQKLLQAMYERMQNVKVKVRELDEKNLGKVDKNNLMTEMEDAMLTHSKIIDDIFQMKNALQDMISIRNSLTQMLHHKLKFRNQLNLKTSKEIQTYMDADATFNKVVMQIKKVEAQIEKSQEYSSLLRSKIGFIRDLTKLKTQELFGEQSA